jgi:hypothetical protein
VPALREGPSRLARLPAVLQRQLRWNRRDSTLGGLRRMSVWIVDVRSRWFRTLAPSAARRQLG